MEQRQLSLDVLQVASPCEVPWESMRGDAVTRHCGQCQKNVYNLSELTRGEAEALLQRHEGNLCVRFFRRADGTVVTSRCPRPLRPMLRAGVAVASLVLLLLGRRGDADIVLQGTPPPQSTGGMPLRFVGKVAAPATQPALRAEMGDVAEPPATQPALRPTMGEVCVPPPATQPATQAAKQ